MVLPLIKRIAHIAFLLTLLVWTEILFAADPDPLSLEKKLKEQYENCHHWGGEVDGGETKERIEEINNGVAGACKSARKTIDIAQQLKQKSSTTAGLILRVVDCCQSVWEDGTKWRKEITSLCEPAEPYFKALSPKQDPDAQSTYLGFCPSRAKVLYKMK